MPEIAQPVLPAQRTRTVRGRPRGELRMLHVVGPLAAFLALAVAAVAAITAVAAFRWAGSSHHPVAGGHETGVRAVAAGTMLVAGRYACERHATPDSSGVLTGDTLIVLPAPGTYTWNGTRGAYTATKSSAPEEPFTEGGSLSTIAEVRFTSGPLKGRSGLSWARGGNSIGGYGDDLSFSDAAGASLGCATG